MRYIKTICDSDPYLIHDHGGLQVTILQHLAFNLLQNSFAMKNVLNLLYILTSTNKDQCNNELRNELLKYNTNVCTYCTRHGKLKLFRGIPWLFRADTCG